MVTLFLCLLCIGTVFYYRKREQRLLARLQDMLDEAALGIFEDKRLDESRISMLENSLWRYLCNHRLAYQDILKQKEQMQELISDISHQSVTPISNVMLYAQLLEEGCLSAEDGVNAILDQARELDFLIQSLLKLSRLETGIISVSPREQCIGPVLQALKQQFSLRASQKGILFEVEDSPETAVFDRKWTMEAAANIVENAVKYTPAGGKVSVRARPYTIFLRIDVEDNGIGIPEAEQGKIFTRFYRSDSVHEEQGMGIGLYLAREVIRAQDGYMKVESEEGNGSTFSIFLLKTLNKQV